MPHKRIAAVDASSARLLFKNTGVSVHVHGWDLQETGGTTSVTLTLLTSTSGGADPTSSSAQRFGTKLAASGESHVWYGDCGVQVDFGLFLQLAGTGTIKGSVFIS